MAMRSMQVERARRLTVSVVVPAFNEEHAVEEIVERLLALRPAFAGTGLGGPEVIVVDDGSLDSTAERAARYPDVRLIRHASNRGYGAALKTGLAQARGDLVAFLDADGTYPPEDLLRLCQASVEGADVVIGSRMAGAESAMPITRRVGNIAFAAFVSVLGRRRLHDCASGMRVIRREALPQLYPLPDGLNFTPVMTLRALHEGLRVVEVPIPYAKRIGRSKLSVVGDGLVYVRSLLWTALGYSPVRVLGTLGLLGVATTIAIAAVVLGRQLWRGLPLTSSDVAAMFVALVTGVAGVSLFNLGATFNHFVGLFRGRRVRTSVFGTPLFRQPLESHFGWLGMAVGAVGGAVGGTSLALGLRGWPLDHLWLALVASALLMLVGLQLVISWVVIRTLEDLAERDVRARSDLAGGPPGTVAA
jgi:glycosyltransferase involved in cell wall biosynthesis